MKCCALCHEQRRGRTQELEPGNKAFVCNVCGFRAVVQIVVGNQFTRAGIYDSTEGVDVITDKIMEKNSLRTNDILELRTLIVQMVDENIHETK